MKTGLAGYPIDHSLSPAMHNAAYRELGLDWHYSLYSCATRKNFEIFTAELLKNPESYVGINVTTPYKVVALELSSERSLLAQMVGNANVLTLSKASAYSEPYLCAENTDGCGLAFFLRRSAGLAIEDSNFVVCGTGAVALSTLAALIKHKAAGITVASRDSQSAQKQIDALTRRLAELSTDLKPPAIKVVSYLEVAPYLANVNVLIDATTLGMNPSDKPVIPIELIRPGMVVFDVVYGHGETALIRGARAQGAYAYDGLGMLAEQAALTIEVWAQSQGITLQAPRALMLQAAQNVIH